MKLLKRMLLASLVACSLVLVAPVVIPMISNGYTVEAASSPKLTTKITKAKQDGEYYIVEGKVYNKSKKELNSVKISINLYSKKDKKSKINTYTDFITYMGKKDIWKFSKKIYVGDQKVKSYSVKANGEFLKRIKYEYTNLKSSNLEFKKSKYTYTFNGKKYTSKDYEVVTVKGKITNKTGKKLSDVFATIAFYNKNGEIVDTTFVGWYDGKGGNEKYKFSIKNNKSFKYSEKTILKQSSKVTKAKVVDIYGYDLNN